MLCLPCCWLCNQYLACALASLTAREEAVAMGSQLISRKFGHHVCNEHDFEDGYFFYRLLDDDETNALNMMQMSECQPGAGWFLLLLIFILLCSLTASCCVGLCLLSKQSVIPALLCS